MPSRSPYTIAVATHNRISALKLSIPRFVSQTIPPTQIVIADSSDDSDKVLEVVNHAARDFRGDLIFVKCEKGLTRQRNCALKHVTSPITFFPDDDSIWFPETAEKMLRVYNSDAAGQVSAVCAREAKTPPADFGQRNSINYDSSSSDKIRRFIAYQRRNFEDSIFPDPFRLLGRSFIEKSPEHLPFKKVEYMTGFRMSFRTEVARQFLFDEALTNYSLNEDIDASFQAWKYGIVAAADDALVFHHRVPGARGDGRTIGITNILNRAYVIAKHSPAKHPARFALARYSLHKIFLYSLGTSSSWGRARFFGACRAFRPSCALAGTAQDQASTEYLKTLKRLTVSS